MDPKKKKRKEKKETLHVLAVALGRARNFYGLT
jgi:hypothetical protein